MGPTTLSCLGHLLLPLPPPCPWLSLFGVSDGSPRLPSLCVWSIACEVGWCWVFTPSPEAPPGPEVVLFSNVLNMSAWLWACTSSALAASESILIGGRVLSSMQQDNNACSD